jgi:hypothetical protein
MKDKYKTKKQLIEELEELRRRVAVFEGLPAKSEGREEARDRSDVELSQIRRASNLRRDTSLLDSMNCLVRLGEELLVERTVKGLLERVADGVRDLTEVHAFKKINM